MQDKGSGADVTTLCSCRPVIISTAPKAPAPLGVHVHSINEPPDHSGQLCIRNLAEQDTAEMLRQVFAPFGARQGLAGPGKTS